MKSILIVVVILCLFSCASYGEKETIQETWICRKEVSLKESDGEKIGGNYITGYVVMDGKLNRIVQVREYMRDSFTSLVEYENYMELLQNSYLLKDDETTNISSIMPYYEQDRIVYPHLIFDYTDLGKYTEDEVPTRVRTEDGKSIDFDLYWDYIQQNGVLDGFHCTLAK